VPVNQSLGPVAVAVEFLVTFVGSTRLVAYRWYR
jgi:hypothetical protein